MKKAFIVIPLLISLILFGCSKTEREPDSGAVQVPPGPMVSDDEIEPVIADTVENGLWDFSTALFRDTARAEGEESIVISPVSVIYAMGMTSNGAAGNTLKQAENTFGAHMEDLNSFLDSYRGFLTEDGDVTVTLANGIWFNSNMGFKAKDSFLEVNRRYYGAAVTQSEFDRACVKAINDFVRENTQGMIDDVIDDLSSETVMCLVNAIGFVGAWDEEYAENDIHPYYFTDIDGSEIRTDFMRSTESCYLSDSDCYGFTKSYEGGRFEFVALVPNEDVDIMDFIAGLDGSKLTGILSNGLYGRVYVDMPMFESRYRTELSGILSGMGMSRFFDPMTADLSGIGEADGNIYVSDVIHDAYIKVDEKGTRAAASTEVIVNVTAAAPQEDAYQVILDRPFIFMIVDTQYSLPVFMGSVLRMG